MKNKQYLRSLLFIIPFALGVTGLAVLDRQPLLDSLYMSLSMFFLNYADSPPNILVETARWLAPLATATGIFIIFDKLRTALKNRMRYAKGDSTAVYGPDDLKFRILSELKGRGIDGGSEPVRASKHILLWDEDQNLAFLQNHTEEMKDESVYIRCSSLPTQACAGENTHIFCPEETAARSFWKSSGIYKLAKENGNVLRIMIIGSGRLCGEVLKYALLNNIFSPDQHIEYHVFGSSDSFFMLHRNLDKISDPVFFHKEGWYDSISLFEDSDMIIITEQDGTLRIANELLFTLGDRALTIFSSDERTAMILDAYKNVSIFDWEGVAYSYENITRDTLFRDAKKVNLRYAHLYEGVPETEGELEERWKKLDTFTRYSNVSTADYNDVRKMMLKDILTGISPSKIPADTDPAEIFDSLDPDTIMRFSELEHIRWCRYHYLNNWTYGIPENGKNKDPEKRIHRDLIPFEELSYEEKMKDAETIRTLLGVI